VSARLRCAVLNDYQHAAAARADWSQLAARVDINYFSDAFANEDDAADALAGFEVIVAMRERTPFPASLVARLPRLTLLVTTGAANASIDVAAAHAAGVTVCGTAIISTPTAEMTFALILGLARNLAVEASGLRRGGPWQQSVGIGLDGSTLGIIGLGRLGSMVARVGQSFAMNTLAWSPNLTPQRCAAAGVAQADSLADLLRTSDFVSIHLKLSERSHGLIGEAELATMKPTAYLINTSRGPIVDESALIDALRTGRIAGAGLDVFDIEPLPLDHPFRTLPTVLATPHLGYVTAQNYAQMYGDAVADIAAFLDGSPIRVVEASG
jgi:phosphoglycerate dehydrogenase-like enzyme